MAKNLYDPENTLDPENSPTVEQRLAGGTVNEVPAGSGLYHTKVWNAEYNYITADNELVLQQEGSYIVLGTDRPAGVESGEGAWGAQNANSIDMVVGRMASANGGDGIEPGTLVSPSFAGDAARVYISQLTDIDKNFGLTATSRSWQPGPRSAIAIKADQTRIIGREGVKIITGASQNFEGLGPFGETNSLGAPLQNAPPIELIAGNFTESRDIPGGTFLKPETVETLQPIPLGNNTRDALQDLSNIIDEMWAALFNFAVLQLSANAAYGISPFAWQGASYAATAPIHISYVMNALYHTRINKTMWELNYLSTMGTKYICSRSVSTT